MPMKKVGQNFLYIDDVNINTVKSLDLKSGMIWP